MPNNEFTEQLKNLPLDALERTLTNLRAKAAPSDRDMENALAVEAEIRHRTRHGAPDDDRR